MSTPSPRPTQRRKRSAIWLVVGAMGLLALLLVVFAVAVLLKPASSLSVPGAEVVELEDGSEIFALVTYGTQHDWVGEIPARSVMERFFDPTESIERSTGTGSDEYVIWLSGTHPVTGKPYDFSWWAYASVIDQYGDEIRDRGVHRDVIHMTSHGSSSRGSSGSRPMEPVTDAATVIMVRSELPPFYTTAKTAALRLHDSSGKVVAEVPFPVQHSVPATAWKPDPLPSTKTSGNLAVTLSKVEFERYKVTDEGAERFAWRVKPQLKADWKGEQSNGFRFGYNVFDSLGTMNSGYQSNLSTHTEAWKMRVRAWRNDDFEFEPQEMWQGPTLDLPADEKSAQLVERGFANGASVELFTIGGRGSVTHNLPVSRGGSGSSASSGSLKGLDGKRVPYQMRIQYQDQETTLTVDSEAVHLAFRVKKKPGQRLVVRVTDDQGRNIPTYMRERDEASVLIMTVPADAKSIQPTFIVHETAEVDFFIEPPAEEPLEPQPEP